jgi:hypothetical protein
MPRLCLLGAVLLGLVGCAAALESSESPNLLENGSFERGREPWYDLRRPDKPYWGSFEISDARAFEGQRSLRLDLDSADFPTPVGIAGAIQDVRTGVLPRRLSGRYRVDRWERGAPAQYVQVVVMGFGASNFRELKATVQLAFVLTGIDAPPFAIRNRRFVIAGPAAPTSGRWIPFEFDLHEAFERHWEKVPVGIDKLRVFLEARFDHRPAGAAPPARAEVHFDALYLGD